MQQKTAIALFLTLLSLATPASAEMNTFQLKEGASLVVHSMTAPRVVFNLWTRSGAADDGTDYGLNLLAMKVIKKTLNDNLKKRGVNASVIGGTTCDYNFWMLEVPASAVDASMVAMGEAFRNPDYSLFERKRAEAVIEASRQKREPMRAAYNQLVTRVFAGHPYGHPVEGNPEALLGITRQKFKDFFASKWVGPAIALIAAGDVSSGPLASTFSYSFAGLATGSVSPVVFPEVKPQNGVVSCPVEASRSAAIIGASGPDISNFRQGLAFDLLAKILANRQEEATTSINVWWEYRKGPGLFGMACEGNNAVVDHLTNRALNDIESIRSGAVTFSEVSRAQQQLIAIHQQIQADSSLIARQSGLFLALGPQTARDTYIPILRQISQKDIQEVAIRYLGPSRIVVSKAYGH